MQWFRLGRCGRDFVYFLFFCLFKRWRVRVGFKPAMFAGGTAECTSVPAECFIGNHVTRIALRTRQYHTNLWILVACYYNSISVHFKSEKSGSHMDVTEKVMNTASAGEQIVRLEKVSMGYLTGQEVLRDITLSINRGGFYFLSGVSGVGKSSLLNILALSARPNRGSVRLFGTETTHLPRNKLPVFRRRIGTVFQDYRLIDHLTVEENVGLPLKIAGESQQAISGKVAELLEWVGLAAYHKARPEILSGGQKQRAAIARAVIAKPDILLADEPSGNLDAALRMKFMYLFETLNKNGTTIVFATHDENLTSMFNYPVMRLKDGRLIKNT
jgi:cell division transport system ATP-binding protein